MDRSEYVESGKGHGNFRSDATRSMISHVRSIMDESFERDKQNKIRNYNTYGNGKYINIGSSDRLLGKPYQLPKEAESTADKQSYNYGFYTRGSFNLSLYCTGVIPDYLKTEFFNIFKINPEDNKLTKDQMMMRINQMLVKIGYQDSQDDTIIYESLPEEIKNNEYYNLRYGAKTNVNSKNKR